ncbi:NAD(P)-dependent alcohol dehydrogenase [Methylocaldum szegediense]|uniref:Chloroplastic oxoene reductase n=2 Tax=Methylocaldum szegediense TaxID=73780 RepID=A0ABM9HY45_9GAMM|nr:NAD(P)-dependent alcohol dehydrogenase [Methylocaldum szegediense]CAI8764073.1 chloroplastic oxoene reductase [Methylocaldum szegediense]
MKAMQYTGYGDPSKIREADVPIPKPAPDQLLVKVAASSVNPIDWKLRNGSLRFLVPVRFPSIPGMDLAGEVVEIGTKVTRYRPGDRVMASLTSRRFGTAAEFAVVDERLAAPVPKMMNDHEAAALPLAGQTALQALRDLGRVKEGDTVLIVGASGGVGHYAVQIAKVFGAKVFAVCSGVNAPWVRELGADEIIDYTQTSEFGSPASFDVIFDTVVSEPFGRYQGLLKPDGIYVSTLPTLGLMARSVLLRLLSKQRIKTIMFKSNGEDLAFLSKLAEERRLRSVIDSVFPLSQLDLAHRRSQSGHARGKIVIDHGGSAAPT